MSRILIVLTDKYPYGEGETFIEAEREYWKCFDKVIKSIGDIFDFLTKGDTSLRSEIIRVTDEYRSFAIRIKEELDSK